MSNPLAIGVLLDELTDDLPLFSRMEGGIRFIAQRVRVRTLTHRGDWPLEQSAGIDWQGLLATKPPDVEALAAALAVEWASVPGVSAVEDLTWSEPSPGEARVSATLITVTGERLQPIVKAPGVGGNPSIVVGLSTLGAKGLG